MIQGLTKGQKVNTIYLASIKEIMIDLESLYN